MSEIYKLFNKYYEKQNKKNFKIFLNQNILMLIQSNLKRIIFTTIKNL